MTWRWPSTAETCSHRQTNKSRSYGSCVLTDPPTLICTKTQRGWWTWRFQYFIFRSSDFIRSVWFLLPWSVGSCSAIVLLQSQLYIWSATCLWYCSIVCFRTSKDEAACLQKRQLNHVDRFGRWVHWSPWSVIKLCTRSLQSIFRFGSCLEKEWQI